MPIDTHATYRRLLEAGVPEPQADAQAKIFAEWTEERLVTRDYLDYRLELLEERLERRFEAIDARFEAIGTQFEAMEAKIESNMKQIDARFAAQDAKFEGRFSDLGRRIETSEKRLAYGLIALGGVLGTLVTVLNFFG